MATAENELRLYFENAVERITHGFTCIESDHAAIHKAEGFSAYLTTATVAAGASLAMSIITPTSTASKYLHFKEGTMTLGASPSSFRFIESGSHTLTTATLTAYQRNRCRPTSTTQAVIKGNTIATYTSAAGEIILARKDESSEAGKGVYTSIDTQEYAEWVLAPGTPYLFVVTNNSGTATSGHIDLYWYEEDSF